MQQEGTPQLTTRITDALRRKIRFLQGWITAPSLSKPTSEMERMNDPRRPELKNVPPAGMGGSM
jgi:hypothetical protein